MGKENIRIKDIAERAGVSVGTVDRVLHNRPNVSKAALEKVNKALAEMDYKPNMYASALAYNKKYTFYCVLPKHEQEAYWDEIEEGAQACTDFRRDFGQTDAANSGRRAREVAADDFRTDAERFEHLRGAVTAQCGDAHLGHAFQQACVNGGDIVFRGFGCIAVFRKGGNRFQRKIRMDGRGAVAEKQRVMHDFPYFAGFHDDADWRSQASGRQCAVDGGNGQ